MWKFTVKPAVNGLFDHINFLILKMIGDPFLNFSVPRKDRDF